ncbi:MAG: hypothetical protein QM713_01190 [Arachnia sp.]
MRLKAAVLLPWSDGVDAPRICSTARNAPFWGGLRGRAAAALEVQGDGLDRPLVERHHRQPGPALGDGPQPRGDPALQVRFEAQVDLEHQEASALGAGGHGRGLVLDEREGLVPVGAPCELHGPREIPELVGVGVVGKDRHAFDGDRSAAQQQHGILLVLRD